MFLKTCSYNKDYDWIIFSDDKTDYKLPSNVKIKYMELKKFKDIIIEKMGFKIAINELHKICDFKPAYGYIFEDYIKNYKFWGHCDLDTIMGNLNRFITDEMLKQYDKIFCLGHMILYKNTYENNRTFMKKIDNKELYKEVFTSSDTYAFDETGEGKNNINEIFVNENKKVFTEDLSLNFKIFPTKFVRTVYNFETDSFDIEQYKEAVYIWKNGNIYRFFKNDNKLIKEEFLYAHFQKRKMRYSKKILNRDIFRIIPNAFIPIKYEDITEENFAKIRKNFICFHYFRIKVENLKKRLKKIKFL